MPAGAARSVHSDNGGAEGSAFADGDSVGFSGAKEAAVGGTKRQKSPGKMVTSVQLRLEIPSLPYIYVEKVSSKTALKTSALITCFFGMHLFHPRSLDDLSPHDAETGRINGQESLWKWSSTKGC